MTAENRLKRIDYLQKMCKDTDVNMEWAIAQLGITFGVSRKTVIEYINQLMTARKLWTLEDESGILLTSTEPTKK